MSRVLRIIIATILFLAVLLPGNNTVMAAEPHENPETARITFSGISLFRYYSGSLDYVIGKNPETVETRLYKMPFANTPGQIEKPVDIFVNTIIYVSITLSETEKNVSEVRNLIQQSRMNEVINLTDTIFKNLGEARVQLRESRKSVELTGTELGVFSVPETSLLRFMYEEVLYKLDIIEELLDFEEKLLLNMLSGLENAETRLEEVLQKMNIEDKTDSSDISFLELLELADTSLEEFLQSLDASLVQSLQSVEITLEIEPLDPYVGDFVSFKGALTIGGRPLAGRDIEILMGGSIKLTVSTDSRGNFRGVLQVPYIYVHELDVQAVYQPRRQDVGVYLAALSEVITLDIRYYETGLNLFLEKKAYPGLVTTIDGRFSYGQSPLPDYREIEIYFDDILVRGIDAANTFSEKFTVKPETFTGEHIILVSVKAQKRYAPVVVSAILRVMKVTPGLEISAPRVAMIPGTVGISGKLYSELSPVSDGKVEIRFGKSSMTAFTDKNGGFEARIGTGITFGLIGIQDIVIQVIPDEPWHEPVHGIRNILSVNILNSAIVIALLVAASLFLPGNIRKKLTSIARRRSRLAGPPAVPEPLPAPVYNNAAVQPAPAENRVIHLEPRERILNWYRSVIRLLQRLTNIFIKPNQTLREFAEENSRMLGPAARYFMDFTRMIERLLYSRYTPTPNDVSSGEQFYDTLSSSSVIIPAEPVPALDGASPSGRDGMTASGQTGSNGHLLVINSKWVLILLVLAIIYFACIFLLLLPLLGVSLALFLPMITVEKPSEEEYGSHRGEASRN